MGRKGGGGMRDFRGKVWAGRGVGSLEAFQYMGALGGVLQTVMQFDYI